MNHPEHKRLAAILFVVLMLACGVAFAQSAASPNSGTTDSRINRRCPDATLGTDPAAPCVGEVLNDRAQQPPPRAVAPPNSALSGIEPNREPNHSMVTPPDPSSSTVQLSPPGSTILRADPTAPR